MSLQFAVVHETRADFETATELADRVLCDAIAWLDEDLLVHQRTWLGESTEGQRLTWKAIKYLALDAGITAEGHFDGEPALADARAARRAILYLLEKNPDVEVIVLIRDQDDQRERRRGLEQAQREDHGGIPILVGLAVAERECWVLSGYDPQNHDEVSRLQTERAELGFDPREQSHKLTACKDDTAKRSPKRTLKALSGDDRNRERRCWRETPLSRLRERGTENGLTDYLAEVHVRLVPLIGHPPPS
jgi:hypothetical protein